MTDTTREIKRYYFDYFGERCDDLHGPYVLFTDVEKLQARARELETNLTLAYDMLRFGVLRKGEHVKQLDGSIKYEFINTSQGNLVERLAKALSPVESEKPFDWEKAKSDSERCRQSVISKGNLPTNSNFNNYVAYTHDGMMLEREKPKNESASVTVDLDKLKEVLGDLVYECGIHQNDVNEHVDWALKRLAQKPRG